MGVGIRELTARDVLAERLVTPVFQPIVDIDTGVVVGLEALARGPAGSTLEMPTALFADAARHGVEADLDRLCRTLAVEAALAARVPCDIPLFLNVEPSALTGRVAWWTDDLLMDTVCERPLVIEVTERDLAADPAGLIAGLQHVRRLGFGVAIDDLGVNPASLALLPLVAPDVIKLDMSLVRHPACPRTTSIAAAVSADAERRGALVLAEGIEDDLHRDRAIVLGASLGQGFRYGHPAPLPTANAWADRGTWPGPARSVDEIAPTPWSLVADSPRSRRTAKALLMPVSHHIEERALESCDNIVLGAFQHRRFFTPHTAVRYAELVERCELVGAVAAGLDVPSVPDLRTADLHPDHPLCREWTVVALGPHVAVALIAREVDGPDGLGASADDDRERRFDYVLTHDRDLVVAAARSLAQHIIARR